MKLGIIGGSGIYEIEGFEYKGDVKVDTPYGTPSDSYKRFVYKGIEVIFLSRHGKGHKIPPHNVNYRANIWGFKQLGITQIISFTAVGGINKILKPGDIVIPDNGIDFTSGRASTFFDDGEIYHIDLSEPFCPELRKLIVNSLKDLGYHFFDKGVYVCTNGPRLETAAEIRFFGHMDADIVGMTLFPEVALAREAEICYANVSTVTNYAAGISKTKLTVEEVIKTVENNLFKVKMLISKLIENSKTLKRKCECKDALQGTKISK